MEIFYPIDWFASGERLVAEELFRLATLYSIDFGHANKFMASVKFTPL